MVILLGFDLHLFEPVDRVVVLNAIDCFHSDLVLIISDEVLNSDDFFFLYEEST